MIGLAVLLQTAAATISLDRAVEFALAHRGNVSAAAAIGREARGQHRISGQLPNPSMAYSRTQDPPRQHLTLDQPLSWMLTRGAERSVTEAGIRRALLDSTSLVSITVQDVRRTFFGGLAAIETLRLTLELQNAADSLARIARLRFEAGDIARLELEQAEQDARHQSLALSEARENREVALAAFGRAIGSAGPIPTPDGPLDTDLDLSPSDSALGHPIQVQIAELDSVAADRARRVIRRSAVPFPGFEIGADWDDPSVPGKTLSVIGFNLPLPLWHRNGGERAVADARAVQANAALLEARRDGERRAAELAIRLSETAHRARFARDSLLPAARVLRDRALTAFRVGETGVVPVIEALRSERTIAMSAIQELIRFQEARADWYELFGRGR